MTEKRYEWCADGLDIWDNQKEERIDFDFPVELNQLHDENKQLKEILQEVEHELISITGLSAFDKCASYLGYVEVFDEDRVELDYSKLLKRIEKAIE